MTVGLSTVESELPAVVASTDPFVTQAARHLVDAGGKRSPSDVDPAGRALRGSGRPLVLPSALVLELTHLATLYHDDVMDEAVGRRGAPSANSRWTNTVAILVGDTCSPGLPPSRPSSGRRRSDSGRDVRPAGPGANPGDGRTECGRRSDPPLPRGARRQDRVTDRDLRSLRACSPVPTNGSRGRRRSTARCSASPSSSPTTCSTSPRNPTIRARPRDGPARGIATLPVLYALEGQQYEPYQRRQEHFNNTRIAAMYQGTPH